MRNTKRISLMLATVVVAVTAASGMALAAVLDGGPGDNTIRGTEFADTINGLGGNDTIYGLLGDDEVDGGPDRDFLYGGNEVKSLEGNDRVLGRGGNDRVVGGPGADVLHGGPGDDAVFAGPDEDAAVDNLNGYDGNDRIFAVDGTESVDTISCGIGRDEVRADPADQVASDCEVVDVVRDVILMLEGELPTGQALEVADSLSATPEQLVAQYPVGDAEYSAGYVDLDSSTTSAEVSQGMVEGLQEAKELVRSSDAQTPPPPAGVDTATDPVPATDDTQATISELDTVIDTVQSNGAQIDEVVAQTATPVDQLTQDPAVQSAEVAPPVQEEAAELDQPNYRRDPNWVPKYGYIETNEHNSGYRYVFQRFIWNDWRMNHLKNIRADGNVTWEQEATYNVSDSSKYLGRTRYYVSSMPRNYFDWIRGIVTDTYDYTMGTTNAQRLRPNYRYFTYVNTTRGGDNLEAAGANGQQGFRAVPGCSGALGATCVRKERTDRLIAVGQYVAPGSASYYSTDADN